MAIDRGTKKEEIDVEEVLEELELKVERLKILYEQYFMGIEKMEPQTARKEVTRKILELAQLNLRNTALRYRFNALNQKFGVYVTYWNRTLRAIENGTYVRNVAKAGRDAARRGLDVPDEVLRAMPERMRQKIAKEREAALVRAEKDGKRQAPAPMPAPTPAQAEPSPKASPLADDDDFDATFDRLFDNMAGSAAAAPPPPAPKPKPVPAPAPAKAATLPVPPPPQRPPQAAVPHRPPPPPPAAMKPKPVPAAPAAPAAPAIPPGMNEAGVKELYRKYVNAKKLVGENTDGLRYEQILSTVTKQGPKIMEQHKAKAVEFSVEIKDNKVILKASPKK